MKINKLNPVPFFVIALTMIFGSKDTYSIGYRSYGMDTVKIVSGIKAVFADINTKRKTYEQFLGEFGEGPNSKTAIIGFYEGKNLKMINANYYNDNGKTESDQYLEGNDIVLIYAKVFEYNSPLSVDPKGSTKSMTENWYYFSKDVLIKWVSGGKVKPAGSAEFKKKSAEMKEEIKRNKKLFSDYSTLKKLR